MASNACRWSSRYPPTRGNNSRGAVRRSEPGAGTERDDDVEPYGVGDPIGWFRDEPARIFAVLGTVLFVLGWAGVIYVTFWSDVNGAATSAALRIQFAISLGSTVTLAASGLWIVAVLLWRRR